MRGRGYVGQFSRNSMGRDRHSNPPPSPQHPQSTLSGSCSLFKQASNSILGSYPFSLTPFHFAFLFVLSFPHLAFSRFLNSLFLSLPCYLSFCGSSHIASVFHCPSLSFEAFLTQIRERYSRISTVAITTWISPVLQAVTAQSFHCNYLLVSAL